MPTNNADLDAFIADIAPIFKDKDNFLKDLIQKAQGDGLSEQQIRESVVAYLQSGLQSALNLVEQDAEKNEDQYDLKDFLQSIKQADCDNDELLARLKDFDQQLTAFLKQRDGIKYTVVDLITALPRLLQLDIGHLTQVQFEARLDKALDKINADGSLVQLQAAVTQQQQLQAHRQSLVLQQSNGVVQQPAVPQIPAASGVVQPAVGPQAVPLAAANGYFEAKIKEVDLLTVANQETVLRLRQAIHNTLHSEVGSMPAGRLTLTPDFANKYQNYLALFQSLGLSFPGSEIKNVHPYFDHHSAGGISPQFANTRGALLDGQLERY